MGLMHRTRVNRKDDLQEALAEKVITFACLRRAKFSVL